MNKIDEFWFVNKLDVFIEKDLREVSQKTIQFHKGFSETIDSDLSDHRNKVQEEVDELIEELESNDPFTKDTVNEFADVFVTLFGLLYHSLKEYSVDDIYFTKFGWIFDVNNIEENLPNAVDPEGILVSTFLNGGDGHVIAEFFKHAWKPAPDKYSEQLQVNLYLLYLLLIVLFNHFGFEFLREAFDAIAQKNLDKVNNPNYVYFDGHGVININKNIQRGNIVLDDNGEVQLTEQGKTTWV